MSEFDLHDKDACELLDADHIATKHLFVEYARLAMGAQYESAMERTELARQICNELTVHAAIEDEIFYPALREAAPDVADVVDEAESEHQEAKELVAQIEALDQAGPEMDDLVQKLAQAVEHHVKEERDELFPKAKAFMGAQLGDLGMRMMERQREMEADLRA